MPPKGVGSLGRKNGSPTKTEHCYRTTFPIPRVPFIHTLSANDNHPEIQARKGSSSTFRPLNTTTTSPSPASETWPESKAAVVIAPEGSVRRPCFSYSHF